MGVDVVWSQFRNEQKIDLSNKQIEHLPIGISDCEAVEFLNLELNRLENIPEDVGSLRSLRVLKLGDNALTKLPDCVMNLTELQELYLGHNQLKYISNNIGNLCDLIVLDVSHNEVAGMGAGVGFLGRLTRVSLSANRLPALPPELTSLCGLVEIDVSHNRVKKLPCVRNLLHLKIFKANNNLLTKLQDFSQCRELVHINFSHNLIEEIDSASLNCQPFLKEMLLSDNKIKTIPEDLILLSSLRILDISHNLLDSLPPTLAGYPSLSTLKIEGNPLKDIPRHYACADTPRLMALLRTRAADADAGIPLCTPARTSLRELRRSGSLVCGGGSDCELSDSDWDTAVAAYVLIVNLSHCKRPVSPRLSELGGWLLELHLVDCGLTEVPVSVARLACLRVLALDRNRLHASDAWRHLAACTRTLCDLTLSCNRLEELPAAVLDLSELAVLDVSGNQLRSLTGIHRLNCLHTLDASNNEITCLDPRIGLMSRLVSLAVTGNRFRQPGQQVLAKGTAATLAYLRDKLPLEDSPSPSPAMPPPRVGVSFFVS